MKKIFKKVISIFLVFSFIFNFSFNVFANETFSTDFNSESDLTIPELNLNLMSDEEKDLFYSLIDEQVELEKQKNKNDFDEEKFRAELIFVFQNGFKNSRAIGWSIANGTVASAINVALGMAVGGGIGSIQAFIRQSGTEASKRLFYKTIKTKILSWGANQFAWAAGFGAELVFGILDPGTRIAQWLDSIDYIPNNGSFDF